MGKSTHVYRHFDREGRLLYVGTSLSAVARLSGHKNHSHWFENIGHMDIETYPDRAAALEAERKAIRAEGPIWNIHHKKLPPEPPPLVAAEQSRRELTRSVVFHLAYSVQEVASALGVSPQAVKALIAAKKLGFVEIEQHRAPVHKKDGTMAHFRPFVRITGWQLIDYLESITRG